MSRDPDRFIWQFVHLTQTRTQDQPALVGLGQWFSQHGYVISPVLSWEPRRTRPGKSEADLAVDALHRVFGNQVDESPAVFLAPVIEDWSVIRFVKGKSRRIGFVGTVERGKTIARIDFRDRRRRSGGRFPGMEPGREGSAS